jgi:hypothetical protein
MLAGFSDDEASLLVGCLRRLIENMSLAKARSGRGRAKSGPARTAGSGKQDH